MALVAGNLIAWIEEQFNDANGAPLALGLVYTYSAGTSTPLATFTESGLTVAHTNPIVLNAAGRPPSPIYSSATSYKFIVRNAAGVEQYTRDNVQNAGQVFASTFGNLQAAGSKQVVSGYVCLSTDRLITVNSTGGASPCVVNLLPAASATNMLAIKNMGTVALSILPAGADTLEGIAGAYTLAASASPLFRSVLLVPDGVSAWTILSGHGT